jgi:hypothetical protein
MVSQGRVPGWRRLVAQAGLGRPQRGATEIGDLVHGGRAVRRDVGDRAGHRVAGRVSNRGAEEACRQWHSTEARGVIARDHAHGLAAPDGVCRLTAHARIDSSHCRN